MVAKVQTIWLRVGHDLAEPRRASFLVWKTLVDQRGCPLFGRNQPHLPRNLQKFPNPNFLWLNRLTGHLLNQVSSLIIFIYYYITPGRVKGVCNRGRGVNDFPGSHAHIFHPVSTLIFINIYKRTTEKVTAADLKKWISNRIAPTRASPASAEPRWGSPSLAGKTRHPIYPPLHMTI
jgi:hypothetical protein